MCGVVIVGCGATVGEVVLTVSSVGDGVLAVPFVLTVSSVGDGVLDVPFVITVPSVSVTTAVTTGGSVAACGGIVCDCFPVELVREAVEVTGVVSLRETGGSSGANEWNINTVPATKINAAAINPVNCPLSGVY